MPGPDQGSLLNGAAERQLARSVVGVFVLAAATAVLGPLISYRSDVSEMRAQLHDGVTREVGLYADALDRHLGLLQAELLRLAERPELDLRDGVEASEEQLLSMRHRDSALFATGVAMVDADGLNLFSEPREIPALGRELGDRAWFQRLLALQAPVADILENSHQILVVAVPVLRDGKVTGALVGLVDAFAALPAHVALGDAGLAVLDPAGDVVLPPVPADWMQMPDLKARVDGLLRLPQGGELIAGDHEHHAAATLVGRTGLRLVLVAHEDKLLAHMRGRFLLQLLLLSAVQIGAVLVLAAFVRRSYRLYLDMERRAVRHQKLAALGGASSLIAHEVKNSLNGLNAAVSFLSQGGDPALPTQALKGQVDRLRHLASSLLQFGKPTEPRRVPTGMQPLVEQAVEGLREMPEAGEVDVSMDLGQPLEVPCDPLLLATAVDNLVRNAIEAAAAAKDVGKVKEPRVRVFLRREGRQALVVIEDNAGGPPADFEQHLFEPFVTSKPKGIGLGLSMARQAIEGQGGLLDFERIEGGSRFTIRLPLGEP
jgi:signal transduction histidine kinase